MIVETLLAVLEALGFGLGFTMTLLGLTLARGLWWTDDMDGKYLIATCLLSLVLGLTFLWLVIV